MKPSWAQDAGDFAGLRLVARSPASNDETAKFLELLFGKKPTDLYVLVWRLRDKKSFWFKDIAEAAAHIARCSGEDIYAGVCLSPEDYGPSQRCAADHVAGMVALWGDLDVLGPAHQQKNLPPTLDDALAVLPPDLPPSLVVHTGHGIQPYWLLDEPWVFQDAADRECAAELSERFSQLLKRRAAERGLVVDSVFDLARVLRVPGTTNTKIPDAHCVASIRQISDRRYSRTELLAYLPRSESFPKAKGSLGSDAADRRGLAGLTLDPNAEPPFDKFEALKSSDPRVLQTWNHERKDLRDQSPSAYDMSLATLSAMAGWLPQEIADLMIAWRRKHGHDSKLRQDYFQRTIQKALEAAEQDRMESRAEEILSGATAHQAGEVSCTEILKILSANFGIQITRIVKLSGDHGQYRVETPHGVASVGDVEGLILQNKLRKFLADTTGKCIPDFPKKKWVWIRQALLAPVEVVDRGPDATLAGTYTELLSAYLAEQPPYPSLAEADDGRRPFVQDGRIHIFLQSFKVWLQMRQNEQIPRNELTAELRTFGAESRIHYLTVGGKPTSRSTWLLPGEFQPDDYKESGT